MQLSLLRLLYQNLFGKVPRLFWLIPTYSTGLSLILWIILCSFNYCLQLVLLMDLIGSTFWMEIWKPLNFIDKSFIDKISSMVIMLLSYISIIILHKYITTYIGIYFQCHEELYFSLVVYINVSNKNKILFNIQSI